MAINSTLIAQHLSEVQQRIKAAAAQAQRVPPTLMAVSKTRSMEEILALHDLGVRSFGESYVQEAIVKLDDIQATRPDHHIEWHFIGPIQSNKSRIIAERFDWVHSVDRLKLAQRLSAQRPPTRPPLQVCIQVNIDNEASKSGFKVEELSEVIPKLLILPQIQLRGFMCIPRKRDHLEQQREPFRALAELHNHWATTIGEHWDTLSMGMSDDIEAAILEGASIVRVGTALFGPRD